MAIVIIGIVLLFVAGGLFWGRLSSMKKLQDIEGTETSQIGTLIKTSESVAGEIGAGSFSEYVEIKGVAKLDNPFKSQFTKRDCIYARSVVIREWEEEKIERDSQGKQTSHWERRSENMSDTVNDPDFYIVDGTGKLAVRPKGATIEAVKVLDDFQPEGSGGISVSGSKLQWGSFSFSLGSSLSGKKNLGYRFQEWIIPNDQKVYALGLATDKEGGLTLGKPTDKKTFLVSTRSEEELVASAKSATTWFTVGAIASAIIGVVMIIVGLVK